VIEIKLKSGDLIKAQVMAANLGGWLSLVIESSGGKLTTMQINEADVLWIRQIQETKRLVS
jgi:hypothetical protein